MKKYFSILLGLICLLVVFLQVNAQVAQTITWQDGDPSFTRVMIVENVNVNSVIELTPLKGMIQEPDTFRQALYGLDWSWPDDIRILSAEDIDYRRFMNSDLYLVTDGSGRKVIEVDLSISKVLWEFEGTLGSQQYLERPVDAFSYIDDNIRKILITDQGRHRVIKVIRENFEIEWQYGNETEGIGPNQLSQPSDAVAIPDSDLVFICDKGNNRIILVKESGNLGGTIVWSWGAGQLNNPLDIEYDLSTREVLITDFGNHRVLKVSRQTDNITWQFGTGLPDSTDFGLKSPTDADILSNGNVLICDAGNNRLIEVNDNSQIIWRFGRKLKNLKDADRLSNNKTIVINNYVPSQLGYSMSDYVSEIRDMGHEVSLDSLFWFAETISGITSVKIQIRSENTLADLTSRAPWRGPTALDSFYTNPVSAINPAHNGHRFYQFKAMLETNNPLYTPVLNNVRINYHYYDTQLTGQIFSEEIHDIEENIITRWKSLQFNTTIPQDPANRNKVEIKVTIIDPVTGNQIRSYTASNAYEFNEQVLTDIEGLKKLQAIQLQASLKTSNSSISPILNDWRIEWEATSSIKSQIKFVDKDLYPTSYYRISNSIQPGQPFIDRITVFLYDANLEPIQDVVSLTINSLLSQDTQKINLIRQTTGGYLLVPSIPGIIMTTGIPLHDNGILEVFDRDTLTISYRDPTDSTDQVSDRVVIIQDAAGIIRFEDRFFNPIDTVLLNDTVYVRILNEKDQDLSIGQDIDSVIVYDFTTNDQEIVPMMEVPDSSGGYQTGEFISAFSLPLVSNSTRINGDRLVQTIAGSRLGIYYFDSIYQLPILWVRFEQAFADSLWNPGKTPLYFDMAPNPFYGNRHRYLRIRVTSTIGDLMVDRIDVYNFAGQKIKTIDGSQLDFYYTYPVPMNQPGVSDRWWDLKDESDSDVSSGTYWIKLSGHIVGSDQRLSSIKKLFVIR